MNLDNKISCLNASEIIKKETIWGEELAMVLMGESNIEIKILDSKDGPLSIQSHPDSWEIWKILSVKPGAFIIGGLKEEYVKGQCYFDPNYNKTIVDYCNIIFPAVNDMYLIPQRLIHALGKGIVALEIKPSVNNKTIRIYDWDRGREPQELKNKITWGDICDQKEKIIKLN